MVIAIFMALFLFFLGYVTAYKDYQNDLILNEALLVAFFLFQSGRCQNIWLLLKTFSFQAAWNRFEGSILKLLPASSDDSEEGEVNYEFESGQNWKLNSFFKSLAKTSAILFSRVLAVYNVDLAIAIISLLYLIAAIFNRYIPSLPLNHKINKKDPWSLIKDFLISYKKLWNDPLGQLSLTITTLFWGAGATLRLVIIAWAAYALGFGLDKSTTLSATVAFGVAIGAIIAAFFIKMKDSTKIYFLLVFLWVS